MMFDTQTIVAGLIIVGAFAYIGLIALKKVRAFSPKKSCGDNCGCSSGSKKVVQ